MLPRAMLNIFLLLMTSIVFVACSDRTREVQSRIFQNQLGTYILDTGKTDLGVYKSEVQLYDDLTITFTDDSTFSLNKEVPFIYDSTGTWRPSKGGLEDWNWLYFQSNPNIDVQFDYTSGIDSVFYLNSVTPMPGKVGLSKIYFKKYLNN